MNILFVCSRNQWRSPTAERVFRSRPGIQVRSAGLSPKSPRRLSEKDLRWADTLFVMEHSHVERIRESFSDLPPIYVLDISDDYTFMDPALIELLQQEVEPLLLEILKNDNRE